MPRNESEYEVELFKEEGFQRRRCPKCNRFFWSLGDRKTCGEPPCDEYSFIGNSPTKKGLNLHEMRELYLRFFERNDHTRIHRYPIVARWRDDVFFTQASIYCFQPWVLLGVVKPPANPLTISQTCVRFNDIDNVGKTGRHFTMFEMMAHHSFNTKDNFVYFKDKTVELCHRLLVEDLGIDPKEISYIEAQWAGGGNSGPCFETLVRGVELATLVFMMYKEENGKKKEMEMQVVDTGYGLERFTWLSQGTSSAYEAVFGDILSKLKKEANISEDERILSEYSQVAGLMNIKNKVDLNILRKRVAERLRINLEKLLAEIEPMENLYAICDHTRALMFILQDGVVPSNVKEGYFARLLVRRTLRGLNFLKLDIPLSEIVRLQVNYFERDFPELKEGSDEILKLVDVEVEKYEKTIERGRRIVSRLEDRFKKIELGDLIELYDSQGLTPDLVQEFSSLMVEIPDDFYIKVAEKHEKPEIEEGEIKEIKIPEGIPATELGYYEDSNVGSFKAKVLEIFDNHIVLDKTYFYPEGGGQEADHGWMDSLEVINVQKSGNVVIHEVKGKGDSSKIKKGDIVNCDVDWNRRLQLMQHHTATHIINGAARRVLGNHIWQTGAHKSVKSARLDITHYAALSEEERKEIESLANRIVRENREIDIKFMNRDDAENRYGFRLYQGGVVPGGEIRIVNIKDWDVEACGGMHFDNTKDVGLIKITGSKRIQDGVVRLEFVAGEAARRYMEKQREIAEQIIEVQKRIAEGIEPTIPIIKIVDEMDFEALQRSLGEMADVFSVTEEQLPKTIKRFLNESMEMEEEIARLDGTPPLEEKPTGSIKDRSIWLFSRWKRDKKILDKLRKEKRELLIKELKRKFQSDFTERDGIKIVKEVVIGLDVKNLVEVARSAIKENSLLILGNIVGEKANIVVASNSSFHAGEIAKSLSRRLGGGAHGDKELGIGGGLSKDAERILREFEP